jgi:Ca2+-binding RTX toxin-like protein
MHQVRLLGLLALLGVLLSVAPAYAAQDCDELSTDDTSDNVSRVGNIFLGTPEDDTIVGTSDSDVINAGDGDDLICGRDGDDVINAEGGDDRVYGGAGNDILNGGPGENRLRGGPGNDIVNGGGDDEDCSGGPDADIVNC